MLNTYGLKDFIYKYPSNLSGGMKQRAALIRTLAINPDILLLDEPFSALDYQTRLAVSDDVWKIIKNEKKTTIMITHDVAEAISMADRVIVLSDRPAKVKKIYTIDMEDKGNPTHNRNLKEFRFFYNDIWKDIDIHVQQRTQIISKKKENKKNISYIYSNFISGTFNFYMGITCYI